MVCSTLCLSSRIIVHYWQLQKVINVISWFPLYSARVKMWVMHSVRLLALCSWFYIEPYAYVDDTYVSVLTKSNLVLLTMLWNSLIYLLCALSRTS